MVKSEVRFNDGMTTITVADLQRAVEFYTGILGLQLRDRQGDEWAVVELGGLRLGLYPGGMAPAHSNSNGVSVCFYVAGSLEDAIGELQLRGVHFNDIEPDRGVSNIRRAWFVDPDGNRLFAAERHEPW
jgi:catechol 2,3-dioxygenase